jgi:hypothetical protein
MSFSPNFIASQNQGAPSIINLLDVSTGSDNLIVGRRVYLSTAYGSFLVPSGVLANYIVWNINNGSISLGVLPRDYVLQVLVEWLYVDNSVQYSKTSSYAFTLYSQSDFYYSGQLQTASPIVQNANFLSGVFDLNLETDNANNAIILAGNLQYGQSALDRAKIISKQTLGT